jgi:hypothetical protein
VPPLGYVLLSPLCNAPAVEIFSQADASTIGDMWVIAGSDGYRGSMAGVLASSKQHAARSTQHK